MLILGIDTATARSSVALCDNDTVLVSAYSDRARRHGEFVPPAIAYCLREAAVTPGDVGLIAVDVGPGLYTGMRVGIGVAQTLAAAHSIATCAVTSTDALAYALRHLVGDVLVSLDGRRGEVFLATYRADGGTVTLVSAPAVVAKADAVAALSHPYVAVVGDGFDQATLQSAGVQPQTCFMQLPQAADVAAIARTAVPGTPDGLQPVYLRHADAKIGWETRGKFGEGSA